MKTNRRWFVLLVSLTAFALAGCNRMTVKTVMGGTELTAPITVKSEEPLDITVSKDGGISFSLSDFFIYKDSELQILSNKPCEIYYTLDGTDPDQNQLLYQNPIKLIAAEGTKAVCIRAKAYYQDGGESDVITRTYFVGRIVRSRFNTLVFSVTTDPYNLYDDEYGILVEGKLREDYIKAHPYEKIEASAPANYNMRGRESEREVYLEVFEPDGTRIAAYPAGIRTYGGWSRASQQKSIKIYTRKEYDRENNKLRYEFFPWKLNAQGEPADAFKRLVLRNSGNDNGLAFIRDELLQTLAGDAGYMDYQAVRPAVLYINGEYKGVFWLHEVYDEEYFDEYYGNYSGTMKVLEGGEIYKKLDKDGDNTQEIADYEAMYAYAEQDLTDDATYQELCKLMDVENYLAYYALQLYIGNEDWPDNNYKTYRYYAKEGEDYREAPFDGKWRYLPHDMDYSFGIYGNGALNDNLWKYIGSKGAIREECPMFGRLMQRKDCQEFFIVKTMDLINGAFSPTHVDRVLEEMNTSRIREQKNMYHKNLLPEGVEFERLNTELEVIRTYAEQRAEHIPITYKNRFQLGELYQLTVQPAEGCKVKINSILTEEFFEGSYFPDYATVLSPVLPEGKEFGYWQVNDKRYQQEQLAITASMLKDQRVEVICYLK